MIRFGKSSASLLTLKQSFFEENEAWLAYSKQLASVYVAQPRRTACKVCTGTLGEASFTKHGIEYVICVRCGHLNGAHEDTDAFCSAVYTDDGGERYARAYDAVTADAFTTRKKEIYSPKVQFLIDALREQGEHPEALFYADLGAGSGYLVGALLDAGLSQATGYEVSQSQVAVADRMVGPNLVRQHELNAIESVAAHLEAEVVSLIGVLEHVQRPRGLLDALRHNEHVRYIYVSVPLFSPCVFFEMAFEDVMPRQLSGGHTHLYTESSLDWTCREFDLDRVAEWWFGTDIVDLYRSMAVRLASSDLLRKTQENWMTMFEPVIDSLQMELDRQRLASEVHLLLRKKGGREGMP